MSATQIPNVLSENLSEAGSDMAAPTEIYEPSIGEEFRCPCETSLLMIAIPKLSALGEFWRPFATRARTETDSHLAL